MVAAMLTTSAKWQLFSGPRDSPGMCLAVLGSSPQQEDAMRNDARPIGEEFRDIAEHGDSLNPVGEPQKDAEAEGEQAREENRPFVVNRDPGDEEPPAGASER
jgi:hypothetical protein